MLKVMDDEMLVKDKHPASEGIKVFCWTLVTFLHLFSLVQPSQLTSVDFFVY